MIEIIKLLEEIKNTRGTKNKATCLREGIRKFGYGVEDALTVLRIICDPSIATNIASKKLSKDLGEIKVGDLREGNAQFLNFIINECSGKNEDIIRCQMFIQSHPEEYRKTLSEVITQSLSIGMDYKSINKALGYSLITVVEPMLALLADKMNEDDRNQIYAVTEKLDGFRMVVRVHEDGAIDAYSKNGLPLPYSEYGEFFEHLLLPVGYTYDGEILPSNTEGLSSKEQYKAVSKLLRTKGKKDPYAIKYHIFDMIKNEEFDEEESISDYNTRRIMLDKFVEELECQEVVPVIKNIDLSKEEDNLELSIMLKKALAEGREGLMLNKHNATYNHKRSRAIFKMKGILSCDILCKGMEEGTGKNVGKLGAIVCDYKGYELRVGSGFSDEQREYYWNNRGEIIGKVVEIEYTEETENQDGGKSLRFPRYKGVRLDKLPSQVSYE